MKRALLVGINDYGSDSLAYCVNDARDMKTVLSLPEFGFECTVLEDANATTKNIKRALETILGTTDDTVLFYFAGHGAATDYGVFLVTHDANDRVDDGLDFHLLLQMLKGASQSGCSVVIVLDCCHSGALSIGESGAVIAVRPDDFSTYVHEFSDRRVLLAACRQNESSAECDDKQHGVFTACILDALTSEAVNEFGEVTVGGVYDVVAAKFDSDLSQRPVFKADLSGRIVLGHGLMSQAKKRELDELEVIERQAESHLNSVQGHIAKVMGDRSQWHNTGYLTACKAIAPIAEWFEKRRREQPLLKERPRFRTAAQELLSKMKALSSVEPKMRAEFGSIIKSLGSGSFGSVWEYEDHNGQVAAVKVYHGGELGITDKVARFRQGISAMKRLEHPRIVRVHGHYECPLSFTMQLIHGANLRDWAGAIDDPKELLVLLGKVVDTLRHAHSRGVIHRDVKPENIIMAWDEKAAVWEPYLTDFDLAWFSTASLQTHDALGTVFYAAPEQLAKPGSAGAHSKLVDIYALGQVFFYAITRSDPTPLGMANNTKALAERIQGWSGVKRVEMMVRLYEDCTKGNPNERIQSMEEISRRLYDIVAEFETLDPQRALPEDEFVAELKFAVTGSVFSSHDRTFWSPARQTEITVYFGESEITLAFVVHRQPLVDNIADFRQARLLINQRMDALVKQLPGVIHRKGRANPYEVFLDVKVAKRTFQSVALVRSVVIEALSVLEKG